MFKLEKFRIRKKTLSESALGDNNQIVCCLRHINIFLYSPKSMMMKDVHDSRNERSLASVRHSIVATVTPVNVTTHWNRERSFRFPTGWK